MRAVHQRMTGRRIRIVDVGGENVAEVAIGAGERRRLRRGGWLKRGEREKEGREREEPQDRKEGGASGGGGGSL